MFNSEGNIEESSHVSVSAITSGIDMEAWALSRSILGSKLLQLEYKIESPLAGEMGLTFIPPTVHSSLVHHKCLILLN